MYCKFCGSALGDQHVRKCPTCGFGIDIYDGGQTFFESADILAWSQTTSETSDSAMPKTEIKTTLHNFKASGKQVKRKSKPVKLHNAISDYMMQRIIIGVTAAVALVLLIVFAVIFVSNFGNKTNRDTSVPDSTSLVPLSKMVGEYEETENEQELLGGEEPNNVTDETKKDDSGKGGNIIDQLFGNDSMEEKEVFGAVYYDVNDSALKATRSSKLFLLVQNDGVWYIAFNDMAMHFNGDSKDGKKFFEETDVTTGKKGIKYSFTPIQGGTKSTVFYDDEDKVVSPVNGCAIGKNKLHCFDIKYMFKVTGREFVKIDESDAEDKIDINNKKYRKVKIIYKEKIN